MYLNTQCFSWNIAPHERSVWFPIQKTHFSSKICNFYHDSSSLSFCLANFPFTLFKSRSKKIFCRSFLGRIDCQWYWMNVSFSLTSCCISKIRKEAFRNKQHIFVLMSAGFHGNNIFLHYLSKQYSQTVQVMCDVIKKIFQRVSEGRYQVVFVF